MTESDCAEFIKVLKNWQVEESKAISSVLTRIGQVKTFPKTQLEPVYKTLTKFHKQIIKAPEEEVDPDWFDYAIKTRPKLQKMIEASKTAKQAVEKRPVENIDYPESLISGRGPMQQKILKSIYKNFIDEMWEAARDPKTIALMHNILKQIKLLYEDKPDEALIKQINSICNKMGNQSSKEAKEKMLRGQITPKEVALNDEDIYLTEMAREQIRKNKLSILEAATTGFYDQMKMKINKDACEECRYCHQNKAFCEDMKQIRAADQPMTRFMRCNNCSKTWRD